VSGVKREKIVEIIPGSGALYRERENKMATKKKPWYKQKTTWTGVAAILAGGAGIATGSMDSSAAIQTIIGGLALIFGRDAIESLKQ
jgi:hypothetical protein